MDLGNPNLQFIQKIGVGGFGRTFLCNYKGSKVCVKRIALKNPGTEINMVLQEVSVNYNNFVSTK